MPDIRERVSATMTTALPVPVKRVVKRPLIEAARLWGEATSGWRVIPDYLIIGAARSGTTSLWFYLANHPAVGRSLTKEVHYFSTNYAKGWSWYRGHFPTKLYKAYVERRFGLPLITGDASPYYVFHPLAPRRIARALPRVKMILMLRDPVERAYSHYKHEVFIGAETLSFEEAIEREPERLEGEEERILADPSYQGFNHQHFSYLARGLYAEQLETWFSLFPRERFLIISSEEFFADPGRGFNEVLSFLGLAPWDLGTYPKYNARERSSMAPETRRRLQDYFAKPNQELYELMGRDFGWGTDT